MHLLFAGLLLSDPSREEQYEQLATLYFLPEHIPCHKVLVLLCIWDCILLRLLMKIPHYFYIYSNCTLLYVVTILKQYIHCTRLCEI